MLTIITPFRSNRQYFRLLERGCSSSLYFYVRYPKI
nr:MAG TPA: hypothetical protein [Caudoviricetes sp.]